MDSYCIAYKDESIIYSSHNILKNWTDDKLLEIFGTNIKEWNIN
jgi:hypothetical protein